MADAEPQPAAPRSRRRRAFMIDQATGLLTPTGQRLEVINAICTQFASTLA